MAKNYVTRKLSLKLIPVYVAVVLMALYSRPQAGSVQYVAGIVLVLFGIVVRAWAAGYLAKNMRLVTNGPYRHVKNPLYVGTFTIVIGICLIAQGPVIEATFIELFPAIMIGLFIVVFSVYYVPYKKRKEYGRLARLFPDEWPQYSALVPDYFPNFRPYKSSGSKWSFSAYLNNSEHWTMFAVIAVVMLVHFNRDIFGLFR